MKEDRLCGILLGRDAQHACRRIVKKQVRQLLERVCRVLRLKLTYDRAEFLLARQYAYIDIKGLDELTTGTIVTALATVAKRLALTVERLAFAVKRLTLAIKRLALTVKRLARASLPPVAGRLIARAIVIPSFKTGVARLVVGTALCPVRRKVKRTKTAQVKSGICVICIVCHL